MNSQIEIIIRKVRLVKPKDKKKEPQTIVSYSTGYKESDYERGETLLDCWFKGDEAFEILQKDYLNVPLTATFELVERYDGTLRRELTDIFDDDGCSLLN